MMLGTMLRALGALGVTLGAGCVLLLDDSPVAGPHCRFVADDETRCGRCIAQSCQGKVDQCCAQASCAAMLSELDQCSAGTASCAPVRDARDGAYGDLGTCVDQSCGDVCPDPWSIDEQCAAGEGCYKGRCRKRCVEHAECGAYRGCLLNFCSDPPGAPCEEESCIDNCLDVDNHGEPVPTYCSAFCIGDGPCPSGFECHALSCHLVQGG